MTRMILLTLALTLPLSAAYAGTIEAVLFTKGGGLTFTNDFKSALLTFIASAGSSIDVAIYNLRDADVIAALNTAAASSKTVRVVTDAENNVTGHPIKNLSSTITVKDDGSNPNEMHHKFVIIDAGGDSSAVWTGSANFTTPSFSSQNNNAIIIRDSNVAAAYRTEFDRLFVSNQFHQTKSLTTSNFTLTDGTMLELRLSPGMGAREAVANLVSNASSSFYFAIYTYGTATISDAMVARRTLSNYGLFEATQTNLANVTKFDDLAAAGLTVELDVNPVEMHHKYLVSDAAVVATGSYNFTDDANNFNDENQIIIRSNTGIAKRFIQEINRIANKDLDSLGQNNPADTSATTSSGATAGTSTSSSSSSTSSASQALESGAKIRSGPNPLKVGKDSFKFISNSAGAISRVEIYEVSGRLVHTIVPPTTEATEVTWNGRNARNDTIASGHYYFIVSSGGNLYTGRFTAIK